MMWAVYHWLSRWDLSGKMVRKKVARSSSCPLLALPWELIQQVLGMLGKADLRKLLRTSKAMAQQVMQHSSDRLRLTVGLEKGISFTGIRQVLQWAPPACLRLRLVGLGRVPKRLPRLDWGSLQGLFGTPSTADQPHSHQCQQFPCIVEVLIKGLSLPSLVPADLAAACPNLRLVSLDDCKLKHVQHAGSGKGSSSSNSEPAGGRSSSSVHLQQTLPLHCLTLRDVYAPELQGVLPANARLTRRNQPAVAFVEQLRASVPNVRHLNIRLTQEDPRNDFIWPLLGPQLTELHMRFEGCPETGSLMLMQRINLSIHLQKLQKLMMPKLQIVAAADMDLLLSLPHVTHVELDTVQHLSRDYSSHACRWQYLQLHLTQDDSRLYLHTLAKLPLHSLTQPLVLGSKETYYIIVLLPTEQQQRRIAVLQRLAQQLLKCGVKLMAKQLDWEARRECYPTGQHTVQGTELTSAIQIVAPALGLLPKVELLCMVVDHQVVQVMATLHQSCLKILSFACCDIEVDMGPALHTVLSSCPGLEEIRHSSSHSDMDNFVTCLRSLTAALLQQPAGRCIQLTTSYTSYPDPQEMAQQLKEQMTQEEQAGVELKAKPKGQDWGYCEVYAYYLLRRK